MTEEKPKSPEKKFGKRSPPPVVTHKPKRPGAPPVGGQKRSLAISLAVMGSLALLGYEAIDWLDKKLNCEPDPANPEELICKHRGSGGSSYHRSRSSWYGGGGSGSSHGSYFGGFGHSGGGYHFGGG
ncbi:MAG: hypothetical protein CTY15_09300 [Methylocystis sp.]|nr:MAG: hypothetical protein CTY15_09300 [Methylocystis sp.]